MRIHRIIPSPPLRLINFLTSVRINVEMPFRIGVIGPLPTMSAPLGRTVN
jgi:hypothetical protein